ncbi:tetratricopeptide repeat protein [Modicisalibacter tunisiensis]|uniref:Tetratricopeptide repeat protein n=1 Tax=Modicisalibacter tunisiensis TaxID=390637 RepID=A0ABS7WVM2_9GAMM|nr:tetratricopeptide repeat protein [Modicisalibacter tunisiensis]MBZ9566653.1 tetratricopeptide repeat protein [Modicisalibacter tunisiensis]
MNQHIAPPVAETTVIGSFDYLKGDLAYGWAFDPARPQKRLAVELVCDGMIVGYGLADQHREDLAPAGIGDGHHLFCLAISCELYDGNVHTLIAREAESGAPLGEQRHTFGPATRELDLDRMPRREGERWLYQLLHDHGWNTGQARNVIRAFHLTATFQETGRASDALNAWDALAQRLGDNALCHQLRGEAHLLNGDATAAQASYRQAREGAPESPWPHIGLANTLQQLGRYQDAEHAIARALALAPEHSTARTQAQARQHTLQRISLPEQVSALVDQGEQHAAQALLISRLLAQPDDEQATELLGQLLLPAPDADDEPLPGADTRLAFQRQERVLNALLDHVDTPSTEPQRP